MLEGVAESTALRCEETIRRFEAFLKARGWRGGVQTASTGSTCATGDRLPPSGIPGSKCLSRACRNSNLGARALGGQVAEQDAQFKPLWKLLRSWRLAVPAEFRQPVEHRVALAPASYLRVCGPSRLCCLVLLGLHCLLRPGEVSQLGVDDVVIVERAPVARYPDCFGVVPMQKGKTARNPSHAQVRLVAEAL